MAWGVALGGTFAGLLPYLLNEWHFHRPLFGSSGLLEYTASAWCIGAAAVRFYEEPTLARKFGAEYQNYRRAVRAWIPRPHPWTPGEPAGPAARNEVEGRSGIASIRRSHMARIKRVVSSAVTLRHDICMPAGGSRRSSRTGDGGCDGPAGGGSVNRARLAAGVGGGPRSLGRFWPGRADRAGRVRDCAAARGAGTFFL